MESSNGYILRAPSSLTSKILTKRLVLVPVISAFFTLSSHAVTIPIPEHSFDVNFDHEEYFIVGEQPSTPNKNTPEMDRSILPTNIKAAGAGNSIIIQESYQGLGTVQNDKVIVFTDTNNKSVYAEFSVDGTTPPSSDTLVLRWDMVFDNGTGPISFEIEDTSSNTLASLEINFDNTISIKSPGNNDIAITAPETTTDSQNRIRPIHFEWRLDLNSGSQQLYASTPAIDEGKLTLQGEAAFSTTENEFKQLRVSTGGNNTLGVFAIDNLKIVHIPSERPALANKAFQLPINLSHFTQDHYMNLIPRIAEQGYNTVYLSIIGNGRIGLKATGIDGDGKAIFEFEQAATASDPLIALKDIISEIRANGMEPMVGLRIVAKQKYNNTTKPTPGKTIPDNCQSVDKGLAGVFGDRECNDPKYNPNLMMVDYIINSNSTDLDSYANKYKSNAAIINMDAEFSTDTNGNTLTAFEGLIAPAIDTYLSLFETAPAYFLLAIDETDVKVLDYYADVSPNYSNAAEVYADMINRASEYLLSKNITPVIWGDMLLSSRLGNQDLLHAGCQHNVKGWGEYDHRFTHRAPYNYIGLSNGGHTTESGRYHAEYNITKDKDGNWCTGPAGPTSVLDAINYLKYRNNTIVVDWHYFSFAHVDPDNEGSFDILYPSVDYFQRMGFADVWGATWYEEEAIKIFSRYNRDRMGGGMMATIFDLPNNYSWSRVGQHLFEPTLYNSAVYFINPDFEPDFEPLTIEWSHDSTIWGNRGSIYSVEGSPLWLRATTQSGSTIDNASLWIFDHYGKDRADPIKYDLQANTAIPATDLVLPYPPQTNGKNHRVLDLSASYLVNIDSTSSTKYMVSSKTFIDPANYDEDYLVSVPVTSGSWIPSALILAPDGTDTMSLPASLAGVETKDFTVDFTKANNIEDRQLYQAGGDPAGLGSSSMLITRPDDAPLLKCQNLDDCYLDLSSENVMYAYLGLKDGLNLNQLANSNGFTFEFDFQIDSLLSTWVTFFSYGNLSEGFRLIARDISNPDSPGTLAEVQIQFAHGNYNTANVGRAQVFNFNTAIGADAAKTKITMYYHKGSTNYQATIVTPNKSGIIELSAPMIPTDSPIVFGNEFDGENGSLLKLNSVNFPHKNNAPQITGKIYSMSLDLW